MGKLTTHILDTASGCPAENVRIDLFRLDGATRHPVCHAITNADGRCDGPLLEGHDFQPAVYELVFQAGSYLETKGFGLTEPKFLDEIVIRFGIASDDQHYHVPLLLSPYGYSTYRGS